MPVLDRERRSTAGRRMTELAGQDAENDAAFWGHETWNEGSDSGNESFHSSDEDSEVKQDVFDSDFDESESDREDEEAAAGDEEDKLIARGEKKRKELKSNYSDVVGKQQSVRGKRIKGSKRVLGHGLNAGIVLNAPGAASSATPALVTSESALNNASQTTLQSKAEPRVTLASTRPRRTNKLSIYSSRFRAARPDANSVTGHTLSTAQPPLTASSSSSSSPTATHKKKKRHRHTQEELLLEAAHETEGENVRWLLARKRHQEQQKDNEGKLEGRGRGSAGKLIMQYSSRRGYLNTITFPEMDHVPEILTRSNSQVTPPAQTFCVITGLKARYRDPRTGLGYYDSAAFKELRRRCDAGEPVHQRNGEAQDGTEKSKVKSSSVNDCATMQSKESVSESVDESEKAEAPSENGSVKSDSKATNLPTSSSNSDLIQAPESSSSQPTAEPIASTSLSRQSSPGRRKPSTKILEAREAGILTNGPKSPPPATISPSRPSQEPKDGLAK